MSEPHRAEEETLPRLVARVLSNEPWREVVYDDASGWLTRGELDDASRKAATDMAGAGLRAGDRILISSRPCTSLVVAHLAALRLGLVVVPMNTAYTHREIAYIASDAKVSAVATDEPGRAGLVAQSAGREIVTVQIGPGGVDVTSVATGDVSDVALDTAGGLDPALIVYTSGTTGRPKGALLNHRNIASNALGLTETWRWTPDDRLVLPLPLFHVHGLAVGLHGSLVAGGSVVLRDGFRPSDTAAAIQAHKATMLFGVPTIYGRLVGERRLGRLRLCVSGSAPLPVDLHRRFEASTGQVILERYGMSETLINTSNPYEGERRPGTVGLELPGVEVRIDRPAGGDREAAGEILVRGPNVFGGYWGRPDATEAAFEAEWFRTGDIGRRDADGYLSIVARTKELVISGGYNVYPREVEDVLREHPAVGDVAVVGRPDDDWGETVVAFVERAGAEGPTESELLEFAALRLAPYKRPKAVVLVAELPRNSLGKVVKSELDGRG